MDLPLLELNWPRKVRHVRLPDGDHLGWPGLVVDGTVYRIIRYNAKEYAYEVEKYEEVGRLLDGP